MDRNLLTIEQRYLVEKFPGEIMEIAEAWVRGWLIGKEEIIALGFLTEDDIEEAKKRVPLNEWRLELRIERLETIVHGLAGYSSTT